MDEGELSRQDAEAKDKRKVWMVHAGDQLKFCYMTRKRLGKRS